jgi:hypothetical protein
MAVRKGRWTLAARASVVDNCVDGWIEEAAMQAAAGDEIVVRGHRMGEPDRDCEVLEVRGSGGGPPHLVRWGDSGHETLFFPGPDAFVRHFDHAPPRNV